MRVVTTNCDSRVPLSTQITIWWMYDNTKAEKKDYFHVFELTEKDVGKRFFTAGGCFYTLNMIISSCSRL